MTFFLMTDEYDSMESMGNEHETRSVPLKADTFNGAVAEATHLYRQRTRYLSGEGPHSQQYPQCPRVCAYLPS